MVPAASMGPGAVCSGGDSPCSHGPHKTLYNRFRLCSDKGVFDLVFSEEVSASDAPEPEVLMLDATALKAPIPPHPAATATRGV